MGGKPDARETFTTPLATRYASREMAGLFSDHTKFTTWRKVWLALAESEYELGLPISEGQLKELRSTIEDIDYDLAEEHEKRLKHDVMAHLHAWGARAPNALGILHMGATSALVTDNTDAIIIREALRLILARAAAVLKSLSDFAREHRNLACLGYTHGQPAQPTTVGKRACLWMQDLVMDVNEIEHVLSGLACRSAKGTTGTQASYYELFKGDGAKVRKLEKLVAEKLGFDQVVPVCGQTYTRKIDTLVLNSLSGVAQSASKFAYDIRLLQRRHEIEEPFGRSQIGSSAMVYKRNPMRSERICSLARHVMVLAHEAALTPAVQWFERTLDDSAGRRLYIPGAFLAADAILVLVDTVASRLVVYPRVIERVLMDELPFMASETILIKATTAGRNRQELHERLRQHAQAAARAVLNQGKPNDFFARIEEDEAFSSVKKYLPELTDPMRFIGRAPEQVEEFLSEHVDPLLKRLEAKSVSVEV